MASRQLANSLEQLCDRQVERFRNGLQGPQADFLVSLLKVRNIVFVDSCFLGKVDLSPAALLPQQPYPVPKRNTNIPCHPYYSGLNFLTHPLYPMGECLLFWLGYLSSRAINCILGWQWRVAGPCPDNPYPGRKVLTGLIS